MDVSLSPLIHIRSALRERLLADGQILSFSDKAFPVDSMCAIDGARIRELMYVADLLVAVATTVDAKSAKHPLGSISSTWADIIRHVDGTDRLAEVAMGSQEILLAASAPHDIRIIDGSFQTPIIAMREGLFVKNTLVQDAVADILLGEWEGPANLSRVAFPERGITLAVPKSDSANKYAELYAKKYDLSLTVGDRFLASQVLLPGEMLAPRIISELAYVTVNEVSGSVKAIEAAQALRKTVKRIAETARDGQAYTTYFKPYGPEKSGAVIRFEYIADSAMYPMASDTAIAAKYASILSAECSPPFMLEPFMQWAVDRQAKNISAGTSALRATLIKSLPPEQAMLFAQNYRT
jgi:hypothetical protein